MIAEGVVIFNLSNSFCFLVALHSSLSYCPPLPPLSKGHFFSFLGGFATAGTIFGFWAFRNGWFNRQNQKNETPVTHYPILPDPQTMSCPGCKTNEQYRAKCERLQNALLNLFAKRFGEGDDPSEPKKDMENIKRWQEDFKKIYDETMQSGFMANYSETSDTLQLIWLGSFVRTDITQKIAYAKDGSLANALLENYVENYNSWLQKNKKPTITLKQLKESLETDKTSAQYFSTIGHALITPLLTTASTHATITFDTIQEARKGEL